MRPFESKHADLLNQLHEMQLMVNYACRRETLKAAEVLIVQQEQTIAELVAACNGVLSYARSCDGGFSDHPVKQQAREAITKATTVPKSA